MSFISPSNKRWKVCLLLQGLMGYHLGHFHWNHPSCLSFFTGQMWLWGTGGEDEPWGTQGKLFYIEMNLSNQ